MVVGNWIPLKDCSVQLCSVFSEFLFLIQWRFFLFGLSPAICDITFIIYLCICIWATRWDNWESGNQLSALFTFARYFHMLYTLIWFCRNLKTLFLEESSITDNGGEWLHELALNNTVLENLNFYMTELSRFRVEDLELIARNCRSLASLKISDCDILDLVRFLQNAASLEEFGGGSFNVQLELEAEGGLNEPLGKYAAVTFPQRLCNLGLTYLGNSEMPIVFPIAARLRKLDLLYAFLDTEGHCLLLERCPNLEVLEVKLQNPFHMFLLYAFFWSFSLFRYTIKKLIKFKIAWVKRWPHLHTDNSLIVPFSFLM